MPSTRGGIWPANPRQCFESKPRLIISTSLESTTPSPVQSTRADGFTWILHSVPALNHFGSNTNSGALIWVLPESGFAAVVCTNTGEPQAFPACDEMIGHLMMEHTAAKNEQVNPERLVGRYQLTPNFIFDVNLKDGRMMVGITNQPTQEVFADSPTRWSYRSVDATLVFHLREKGPAYALTLLQNGAAQQAKRIRE